MGQRSRKWGVDVGPVVPFGVHFGSGVHKQLGHARRSAGRWFGTGRVELELHLHSALHSGASERV